MKILIAADGSGYTERILDFLASHGMLSPQNELVVFSAVPPIPHRAAAFAESPAVQKYYDDDAQVVLRPVRDRLGKLGASAMYIHEIGNPAELIARQATAGRFDLVAMGSHGHGAVGNLVLGSVATKVLALCKTPVLLVR